VPITNTNGQFNVGRDLTIVLIGPNGRVDLTNVTGFSVKQETAPIKADRLDGVQMNAELPKGWSGTIECDRGNPVVDQLFAQIEAAWFGGSGYQVSQMFQYVEEAGGGISTWAYDNVALKLDDAGDWKPDQVVKQRISFIANRRRSV
jgi:hypothetical protein